MAINEPTVNPIFDEHTFGFLTLGIGSYFAKSHYHTSLLLIAGEQYIQVDLPSPYCKILHEATTAVNLDVTLDDIDSFICTHVHGDHSNGCEGVGLYKHFIQSTRPALYVLPEVADPLWNKKLSASMGVLTDKDLKPVNHSPTLETYFDVNLVTPSAPTRFGDTMMFIRRTKHALPCFAMKFERNGKMLGYSCDTIYDEELIRWLSDCDLIFHETTPAVPHTPYEKLRALDSPIKKKMVLIHLADGFETDDPYLRPAQQGALYSIEKR